MPKREVIVMWCPIHRATIASTAQAREPYCRPGLALREKCRSVMARVRWDDEDDE